MTTATPVQNFEEAQSVLAASLPGYVRRPHQIMLGNRIEECMDSQVTLMAQAGTGTGKSIALLIPSILHAVRNDTRVVIATATKALQQQYKDKDLPFLAEHLGIPFRWAILKGRSNYACEAKIRELASPTRGQGSAITVQRAAEKNSEIIDRDGLPAVSDFEWQQLSMTANECPGASNCPFGKNGKCMAENAKAVAAGAHVVVTNIAYLLRDLKLRQQTDEAVQLLGEFSQLAIDEAHNLPDAVTSALADSVQLGSFIKLAGDLAVFLDDHSQGPGLGNAVGTEARRLFEAIDRIYAGFTAKGGGKADPMPLYVDSLPANPQTIIGDALGPLFIGLYQAIEAARTEVVRVRVYEENEQLARYRLMRRTEDWLVRLAKYTMDKPEETVRWVEQERNQRNTSETKRVLCSAPVQVGQFLRSALWSKVPTILMSATLANGGEFGFMAETMGLDSPATYDAGSPFNYAEQAMLYVPGKNDPSPKDRNDWAAWAPQVTRRLVLKSGGDALLLFTSRSAMESTYTLLARDFESHGIRVLKQGDMPNGQLITEFRKGGAVLFGLKTFMEGVDIPGKALRLVVLDKLPFSVPTDIVIAARVAAYEKVHGYRSSFGGSRNCQACQRAGKTCTGMTIPQMQLVLEQAFGRLIRTVTDTGVVAVLDSRLSGAGWGRQIVKALPPAKQTTGLPEAEAFLAG
jgi:ATP-dependent DNA helicase DinG